MRLTVLGMHSGGIPAGSGYLVEAEPPHATRGATASADAASAGDAKILLDCGNGVLTALEARISHRALTGIILTHLHHDHVADLYPITLSARYGKRTLPLLAPEGTREWLARYFALFSKHPDAMLAPLDVREMRGGETFAMGPVHVSTHLVEHDVPGLACRIEADGRTLAFTGDTRPCKGALDAARGADLLLAEATFTGHGREASRADHMTAADAATLARDAGVKRLVLTHVLAHLGTEAHLVEARAAFAGPVEVARVGATYEV